VPYLAARSWLSASRPASIEKLGTVCSYKVTGLSEVAGIITDAPAGEPTVRQLREDRVTIIEA
jgi:DeoR/GlpR family transcriptional regulator of sugar metabolism